jgi:hypothetical protein
VAPRRVRNEGVVHAEELEELGQDLVGTLLDVVVEDDPLVGGEEVVVAAQVLGVEAQA